MNDKLDLSLLLRINMQTPQLKPERLRLRRLHTRTFLAPILKLRVRELKQLSSCLLRSQDMW